MFNRYVIKKFDFITVVLLILISIIGVIMIGSASGMNEPDGSTIYRDRQIFGLITGFVFLAICAMFDYHWYKKLVIPIFVVNIAILSAVLVAGEVSHDAQRWLEVGPFRFQPSEFSKVFIIIILATYFDYFEDKINNVFVIIGSLAIALSTMGLIFKQPDFSTSIVIFILFIFILYVAKISYFYILGAIAIAVPSGLFLFRYIQSPNQKLLRPYMVERILAFISPEKVNEALLDQSNYSVIAIASGQATGKGLYLGKVNAYNYLPESHTDFIFAVFGEEFGFFGAIILLMLVLLLIIRLIYIGINSSDLMGKLLVTGIATLIAFQTFINVGVCSGILPNTGLTFPFLSYGISSLWADMMAIGIALNVSLQPKKTQSELNISGVNILRKEVVK